MTDLTISRHTFCIFKSILQTLNSLITQLESINSFVLLFLIDDNKFCTRLLQSCSGQNTIEQILEVILGLLVKRNKFPDSNLTLVCLR